MNNEQFVSSVSRTTGMKVEDVSRILNASFSIITNSIILGNEVEIESFGTFVPIDTEDRKSISNPDVMIKGHRRIKFVPSTMLKQMLNVLCVEKVVSKK